MNSICLTKAINLTYLLMRVRLAVAAYSAKKMVSLDIPATNSHNMKITGVLRKRKRKLY